MKKIILASTSPRRIQMLKDFKMPFRRVRPEADEEKILESMAGRGPAVIAQALAYEKAASVRHRFKKGLIIGADTLVVLDGEILGKPRDLKDAERMLRKLGGSTHRVITGVAFIDAATQKTIVTHDTSHVTFLKMTTADVRKYIRENNVLDKAGAYAIQEGADPFIKSVKGSYYNVVGLPIELVKKTAAVFRLL